jgi:hypothetical protein
MEFVVILSLELLYDIVCSFGMDGNWVSICAYMDFLFPLCSRILGFSKITNRRNLNIVCFLFSWILENTVEAYMCCGGVYIKWDSLQLY